jgi:hypothetical protein
MARTAQDIKLPGAPTPEPPPTPSTPPRTVLGWAGVVAALIAAAVLAIVTLTANGENVEVSRGSDQHLYNLAAEIEAISAVEGSDVHLYNQAAEIEASSAVEGSDVHLYNQAAEIAEHGSLRAIEHRSGTG